LLKNCYKNGEFLFECYELSLLASIHPLFDDNQKQVFKAWSNRIETSIKNSIDKLNSNKNLDSMSDSNKSSKTSSPWPSTSKQSDSLKKSPSNQTGLFDG
jgi:hypothetical protein